MSSTLAAVVPYAQPRLLGEDRLIRDLFHDSRDVVAESGFVAVRGSVTDGHLHVAAACAARADLVVVDHEVKTDCPQLIVADTRATMADLAAAVHRAPATELKTIGVTGTNGKTTVTHMIESIVEAAGAVGGIVGTIGAHIAGAPVSLARTTPEATDLQRLLRRMVDASVSVAALEVSSHALVLGRADAIVFDVVGFTNLSQDHLDFHHDMESYFAAKADLFTRRRARHAVIWMGDPAGRRLADMTELPTTTVGFGPAGASAVTGEIVSGSATGTVMVIGAAAGSARLHLPLAGRFNVANALVAAALTLRVGVSLEEVASGLEELRPVPGRFESVPNAAGFEVVVDYAHTPEAVASAIGAAREVAAGRVIAVVGSAGDRDPSKRLSMGEAAAAADLAVITSDNPRSEDPQSLVDRVLVGAGGRSVSVVAEVDRRAAIRTAFSSARSGDIVLILGKGHEPYQEFAERTIDFDDRLVAAEELAALGGGVG